MQITIFCSANRRETFMSTSLRYRSYSYHMRGLESSVALDECSPLNSTSTEGVPLEKGAYPIGLSFSLCGYMVLLSAIIRYVVYSCVCTI